METLTTNEARVEFGEALQKAQHEPVLMSIESYKVAEELKMRMLKERIARAERDIEEGNFADGEAFMRELIGRERG